MWVYSFSMGKNWTPDRQRNTGMQDPRLIVSPDSRVWERACWVPLCDDVVVDLVFPDENIPDRAVAEQGQGDTGPATSYL